MLASTSNYSAYNMHTYISACVCTCVQIYIILVNRNRGEREVPTHKITEQMSVINLIRTSQGSILDHRAID